MKVANKLAMIGAGYVVSFACGIAAVSVNELFLSEDIQQSSGGMVAFGDMVVFLLASGGLSLAPTWFLLKLCADKFPRALIVAELLSAAIGPASWLAVRAMAESPAPRSPPHAFSTAFGLFVAFAAIPRMVLGPVLIMVEVATFFLIRQRLARALLAAAMLMDLIPLSLFAMHMTRATP